MHGNQQQGGLVREKTHQHDGLNLHTLVHFHNMSEKRPDLFVCKEVWICVPATPNF